MNTIQKSQNLFPDLFQPSRKPLPVRRKLVFGTPRRPGNVLVFMVSFMVYLLGIFPSILYALPSDPTVQAGSVTFDESSPANLTILQSTDKAIIDWRSFGILGNEQVDFKLPSSNGVTLNRVTGNEPSAIFGKLTSNGNLFLINPNGVLFGAGSQIDVNGLVATTSDIRNQDFLTGNYNFNIPSNRGGVVVNRGSITASQGGLVALVAPGVQNDGIITARLGRVNLASGNTFTLDLYGDQLVNLGVGSQVAEQITGLDGEVLTSLVSNRGKIFADGGTVLLNVNAARDVVDQVINMSGIIQAKTAENRNGTIILRGGDEGRVDVSGTLDASGLGAGETGGTIHVFGDHIGLFSNALLNASGDAGGGNILVGGDYQGLGVYPTASDVFVDRGASIYNDAISSGHGGRSIFWANRRMRFFGSVYARGGREWGDGGFIEVSGKEELFFDGWADTSAPNGLMGTLLLDPEDINIANGSGASSGVATFTIFEETLEALSGNTNIDLLANNSITLNNLSDNLLNLNISGSVTMTATNGAITFLDTNDKIKATRSISLIAGGDLNLGSIESTEGNITLQGANVNLAGTLTSFLGANTLTASQGITLNGNASSASDTNLNAGTSITLASGITLSSGGTLTLTSTTGVNALGAVTVSSANGLTLNDNFTSAGAATFDVDSDDDGTGSFTVAASKTVSTGNSSLSVTGGDIVLNGSINSGTGTTTLLASNAGTIGMGTGAGTFSISDSELDRITAGSLTVGDSTTGNIAVAGVSLGSNIAGTTTLNATQAGKSVTFSGGDSTFNTLTVNAENGITASGNLTTAGAATFDADSDNDGTGIFTVATGKTVATGNNSLSITGGDIALNGSLDSGTGTTTLLASKADTTIGLGTGAGTFSISDSELGRITAGGLTVGDATNGNITVDSVTAANSNNIAGTTTLNATKSSSKVTFSGAGSTFNALTVNAGNGVAANTAVTTDTGDLILSGGAGSITGTGTTNLTATNGGITLNNSFSSTGDANINAGTAITLASGITVASGGTLTLTSTTGTNAQGAVTVEGATGIALNSDFTSAGATVLDADSDDSGTGSFSVATGKIVTTGNNSLVVIGADIALNGSLNSGAATTTLLASNGRTIGLGAGAGVFSLGGSELQNITAANLVIGDSTNGNITVDGITSTNSNNIAGTTTLNATQAGKSVTFSGGDSTFKALTVNAENGITASGNLTTAGAATFDADSDDDGTGSFTVATGKTVSTGNNSLSITSGDIALSGNLNSGTGSTTLLASKADTTIGLGAGTGTFSVSDGELDRITAGGLTIGDSTNGDITVDGASVGSNIAGTTTLNATKTGSNITFANASSFGDLAVNAGATITDNGIASITATGTSSFSGTTSVSLTNTANLFTGAVSLNSGGDATLLTNNALTLATSTLGGTMVVTVGNANGLIVSGDQTAAGTISLTAADDITLTGGLFSSNASGSAISLTSTTGGIFDGDSTGALDISAPTGGLVANSVTGFGTALNPIETKLASVDINNTSTGDINIFETDSLDIVNINHSGTGDITVSFLGTLTGQENAIAADGSKTFTTRDSGSLFLPEFGKTLSELSTEQTVSLVSNLESSYFFGNQPSATGSKTVTQLLSSPSSGPFVTNVFDEKFELIQVAKKTRRAHKGMRGFSRFWGPAGTKNTEMVKRPSRKSVREEAKLRKKSGEKRKRLERKRRAKIKNARLKRMGDTAALPKNRNKKKTETWFSQTLETFFK